MKEDLRQATCDLVFDTLASRRLASTILVDIESKDTILARVALLLSREQWLFFIFSDKSTVYLYTTIHVLFEFDKDRLAQPTTVCLCGLNTHTITHNLCLNVFDRTCMFLSLQCRWDVVVYMYMY